MDNFVSKCTNQAYYLVEAIVVKSLQNPAWVFRGNVVSHMDVHATADFRRVAESDPCGEKLRDFTTT
jgi:hypothetical protein